MAENSKIGWTDHTFNAWIGCTKVSSACDHCYAEALNHRMKWTTWGNGEQRYMTSDSNWKQPLKWNRKAEQEGRRYRVFANSLSDVFDAEVPYSWRERLITLIAETPNLDWLILTKRPKVARDVLTSVEMVDQLYLNARWPLKNLWLGTTAENQVMADLRIPILLDTPAAVRFVSVEPMLGPVDLSRYMWPVCAHWPAGFKSPEDATAAGAKVEYKRQALVWAGANFLKWIICGAESGPGKRPFNEDWARDLRDQCEAASTAFFLKQTIRDGKKIELPELDGRVWAEFPEVA